MMKRGKEITPRRRTVIITFRSLDKPITFKKIKEVTGIPVLTANNIWPHAKKNASEACKVAGVPGLIDAPLALAELITSSALDPKARSGMLGLLNKEDKDRLVLFVKRDFDTWRMKIIDIRREAGFLHVGQTTLLRALKERGIGAYQEFKLILTPENKEKRLVCVLLLYIQVL